MAEDIKSIHQFQKYIGEAIQKILNESDIDSMLHGERKNHPGDWVSIVISLGPSGGAITDINGFSWDLRFPNSEFEIQIAQKRLSRAHPDLQTVHKHFYELGAEIQHQFQPGFLEYPFKSIFTADHLPTVEVEGEAKPIYNVAPLLFRGSTLGYSEDFNIDFIRLSFGFGVQVDPKVLDVLVS